MWSWYWHLGHLGVGAAPMWAWYQRRWEQYPDLCWESMVLERLLLWSDGWGGCKEDLAGWRRGEMTEIRDTGCLGECHPPGDVLPTDGKKQVWRVSFIIHIAWAWRLCDNWVAVVSGLERACQRLGAEEWEMVCHRENFSFTVQIGNWGHFVRTSGNADCRVLY